MPKKSSKNQEPKGKTGKFMIQLEITHFFKTMLKKKELKQSNQPQMKKDGKVQKLITDYIDPLGNFDEPEPNFIDPLGYFDEVKYNCLTKFP